MYYHKTTFCDFLCGCNRLLSAHKLILLNINLFVMGAGSNVRYATTATAYTTYPVLANVAHAFNIEIATF